MTLVGGTTDARVLERVVERRVADGGWRWWTAAVGAVLGGLLAWRTAPGIADDGYITLAMARNVAEHGCWCVTPGIASNTATSPLWVLLLALPMLLVGPVVALGVWLVVLTAGTSLATSALAVRCGWSWWAGPLAAAGLVTSPVLQAAVGLESALAVTLLVVLAWSAADGRPGLGGVVVGLLALTRPDLAVVGVVALGWWRRRASRLVGCAVAVVAPWLLVSLGLFGSLVPDTLAWKQGSAGLGGTTIATAAPLFLTKWPAATLLAVATLAAGALAGAGWISRLPRGPVTLLALAGGAHVAVMVALGVGPFVWYLGPASGVAVLLLALAAARSPRWAWSTPAALLVVGLALTATHDWASQGAPFHANGATTGQYATLAARVPDGATVETAHGEVGAIAFFCADRCTVVDPLSDPGRMAPVVAPRVESSPVLRALYPRWRPAAPVPAQWRTRYAPSEPGALPVWSGYGGWSRLAVEPVG